MEECSSPVRSASKGSAICLPCETIVQTPGSSSSRALPCTPVQDKRAAPCKTPEWRPLPAWNISSGGLDSQTPEAKKKTSLTPPSGPSMLQGRLRDDIDLALRQGSAPMLALALVRGHRCSAGGGNHCIHEAVSRQHIRALEFLLNRNAADIEEHCGGRRPLHIAMQACMGKGDTAYCLAQMLLQHGARPGPMAGDDPSIQPPLHDATRRGCPAAMALLLRFRADANAVDTAGDSPLHIACRQTPFQGGSLQNDVILLLLRHGAHPCAKDVHGFTALSYARDAGLRRTLYQAEHRWSCSELRIALGSARPAISGPAVMTMAEIFECVAKFL